MVSGSKLRHALIYYITLQIFNKKRNLEKEREEKS